MPKTLCDICMEEYEDNDKSEKCPRILNCGHSFCTLCLKKIKQKNQNIICPSCRSIDLREINQITINRAIYDLIWEKKQSLKISKVSKNCGINDFIKIQKFKRDYNTDIVIKLALIGEASPGKTSISKCYINGPLQNEEEYKVTVGLDFFTKILECENNLIKLQIWDTAGQERYQSLTSGYLKGVHGCIIVFDVCDKNTFKQVENWIHIYRDFNQFKNQNIVLVGNKIDKDNREIDFEEVKNFVNSNKLNYFETSAVTGKNVNESFECIVDNILNSDVIEEDKNWKKEMKVIDIKNPEEISCVDKFINWIKSFFN